MYITFIRQQTLVLGVFSLFCCYSGFLTRVKDNLFHFHVPLIEPLTSGVRYTYCRTEQCWYWSADRAFWQREDLLVVQKGRFKGQRLRDDDLARLAKLKCYKEDPFLMKKDCAICEYLCEYCAVHDGVAPLLYLAN